MEERKVSFYPNILNKPVTKCMTKDDTILLADKRIIGTKQSLKNPKRSIVANLGKRGVIKEQPYWIYDEGCDVTPKRIEDSQFLSIPPNSGDFTGSTMFSPQLVKELTTYSHKSSIYTLNPEPTTKSSIVTRFSESAVSVDSLIINPPVFSQHLYNEDELKEEYSDDAQETGSIAPSMFQLRVDPLLQKTKLKTTFTVNLSGSETFILLQIPSTAELLDSDEGRLISKSNSFYENRLQSTKAISLVATQTNRVFSKNRTLYLPRNDRANASTYVSNWEMYDTYKATEYRPSASFHSREEGQVVILHEDIENESYNIRINYLENTFSSRLLVALMILERIIVNNLYRENHLTYNGLMVQDPLSLDIIYNYSLKHLWTFHSEIVGKRTVTSVSWNKAEPNILAVGYGKFYYKDQCSGLVCIWNVKNPIHPERHYEFEHPVTFVTFNPTKNQILAVTFYNGLVLLIDIISWVLLIKADNKHYPIYSPVWQARWFTADIRGYSQILITCGKDGRIFKYKKNKFFLSNKIMSIGKVHGKIQGVEQPKPCYPKKTLSLRRPSVEVLVPHPVDPLLYLVGTADGYIFTCSILHRYDHLAVFQAHTGPVYNIKFNPFCNKVFLSCGMDWCIRIWAEGVYVPLITLHSGMVSVHDVVWSPLHSTVVLSVAGNRVEIWDLRRSTSTPKSSLSTPSESFNTRIYFTDNGYNVCIGDIDGNVHVMAMTGMPFSPMYQEDILVQALKGALHTRPEILQKLKRLGKPFTSFSFSGKDRKSKRKKLNQVRLKIKPRPDRKKTSFFL